MSFFKTTEKGKCDVTIKLLDENNSILFQRSSTYDFKPTFKELKEHFKQFKKEGAKIMKITTTPGCNVKSIKL